MVDCRYYKMCKYRQPEGYTCHHDREASGYCGTYKIHLLHEFKCGVEDIIYKIQRVSGQPNSD